MPDSLLTDALGGVLRSALRFLVSDLLMHLLFEGLIQTTGYHVCKPFYPRVKPDGFWASAVGLLVWGALAVCIYLLLPKTPAAAGASTG